MTADGFDNKINNYNCNLSDGDTINEQDEDDEEEKGDKDTTDLSSKPELPSTPIPTSNGSRNGSITGLPADLNLGHEPREMLRKRSMDDREDDEDLFENPVSQTLDKMAPLSSISEVSLNKLCQSPDVVHV